MKRRLDAVIRGRHTVSWNKAREWIATGKIWLGGRAQTDPAFEIDDAEAVALELRMNAPRARAAQGLGATAASLEDSDVLFQDSQLVVLNKPAGMSTVAFDETEKNSLEQRLCRYLKQARVQVVHRIDRETSGLIVFARTQDAGTALAAQFRAHTVVRRYFALAQGAVKSQTIRSNIVANRGDGLRGSVTARGGVFRPDAKPAVTHVTALALLREVTLLECRLETGRTHQIRIHLAETGHPLLGEKAYNRYYEGDEVDAPRLMLHAAELGFAHPTTGETLRWTLSPPEDFLRQAGGDAAVLLAERLEQAR